jgi:hypothetical protein
MKELLKIEETKEEVLFVIGKNNEDTRTISLAELRNGKKEVVMAKAFGYDFIKPYKKDEKTTIAMMAGKKFHINEDGLPAYEVRFMDVKRFSPNELTTLAMVSDETIPGGFYWTHIFRDGTFVHGMKFVELEKFASQTKKTERQRKRIKNDKFLDPKDFVATGLTFDGRKEILFLADYIKDKDELIHLEFNSKGKELLERHVGTSLTESAESLIAVCNGKMGFDFEELIKTEGIEKIDKMYHDLKDFFTDQHGEDIPFATVHDVDFTDTNRKERMIVKCAFIRNISIHWFENGIIKHCLRNAVIDNSNNESLAAIWNNMFPLEDLKNRNLSHLDLSKDNPQLDYAFEDAKSKPQIKPFVSTVELSEKDDDSEDTLESNE